MFDSSVESQRLEGLHVVFFCSYIVDSVVHVSIIKSCGRHISLLITVRRSSVPVVVQILIDTQYS